MKTDLFTRSAGEFRIWHAMTALLAILLVAGCGRKEPEYFEVEATEDPVVAPAAIDHSGHNHPEAGELAFAYELPDGWTVMPTASMQQLTIEAGKPPTVPASVQVSSFPGDVGGQVANINRWRRQVGLGPVSPEAAADFVVPVTISGTEGWQVDFTGPAPAEDHGAIRTVISTVMLDDYSWFFKIMGTESAVEEELANYAAFLESIAF